MAASGTETLDALPDSEGEVESDDEDMLEIPEEVMQQARSALEGAEVHEIISLSQEDQENSTFVVKANPKALDNLSSQADEIEPYWAVSCLGSTGAGKSFFITKLLETLGHRGGVPYSIDFSETDVGDIPISVTCNILCYLAGSKLLFDVEGTDGTLPLMQRMLMGVGNRLRLRAHEKRMQIKRRDAVAKFFPPIAFAISNTVIYITRESLKNSSTSEAIKEFAASIAGSSTSVRPYLVIVHNLCPINQLRRGKEAEATLVKEFLHAHDDSNFLKETFRGISCMTFPDCYVVDKKKRIDGEAVFHEQLTNLCKLLAWQYHEVRSVRRKLHCALPARSLLTIMPEIVRQTNAKEPISIPDILRTNLANNPDIDCLVLQKTWKTVATQVSKIDGQIFTGEGLKDMLAFCIGMSAHYLACKLATQEKAGFPDQWIEEQAASLHDKLMDYFNMVFARCQATSPHEYDNADGPVECGGRLCGHDCHITNQRVIPSRFSRLWRFFQKKAAEYDIFFRLKIGGGIFDRWEGEFEYDPVLKDAGEWGKKIMQEETVAAVHLLRVSTPPEEPASDSAFSVRGSSLLGFHQHNANHLLRWCQLLQIAPRVVRLVDGKSSFFSGRETEKRSELKEIQVRKQSFCCVCFRLAQSLTEDLHVCTGCLSLCDKSMRIQTRFPRMWSCHSHCVETGRPEVHVVTDPDEFSVFKDLLKVMQPDELGRGRDAETGLPAYNCLEVKHVWRIEDAVQWQKYETGRRQVSNDLKVTKGLGEQKLLISRFDEMTRHLMQEDDVDAGAVMLLHGTKSDFVLPILNRGMNERLASGEAAFGSGIYLCEDPEKMDQYSRAASGTQARNLQENLFGPGERKDLEARHQHCSFCHVLASSCQHINAPHESKKNNPLFFVFVVPPFNQPFVG